MSPFKIIYLILVNNIVIIINFFFQISTMPEQAFLAFMDHGIVARTINANVSEEAEAIYNGVEKLGIDWDGVGSELENQVLETFNKSFNSTLEFLEKKAKCF